MVSLFLNRETNMFSSQFLFFALISSHFTAPLPYHEDVSRNEDFCVGFEVFTAVVMTSRAFWDITQCSLAKVKRRSRGIFRLHLHDWRTGQARNQREAVRRQFWEKPNSKLFFFPVLHRASDNMSVGTRACCSPIVHLYPLSAKFFFTSPPPVILTGHVNSIERNKPCLKIVSNH